MCECDELRVLAADRIVPNRYKMSHLARKEAIKIAKF